MGRILAVLLAGTTGCAQLAGIEETTGVPPPVTLSFERVSVGTTLVRAPQDLTGFMASFLVEDAAAADGFTRVPAEVLDAGTWAAAIPTGTPPALFTLDDALPRIWALPARQTYGVNAVLEHPGRMPLPSDSTVNVAIDLPAAYGGGEAFEVFAVGAWTRKPLADPALGAPQLTQTYQYSTSASLAGRTALDAITVADTVLVLRHNANALTGVRIVPPFDQAATTPITGPLAEVTRDQVLDVTIDTVNMGTRFAAVQPPMTAAPSMSWAVRASPGYSLAIENGPVLHSGALTAASPTALTVMYGNPFDSLDWKPTFAFAASVSRTYTHPTLMLDVGLSASLLQLIDASAVSSGSAIDIPVGVPSIVSIDGVPLTTDGLTIPKPTIMPTVTFEIDRTDNTLYELVLIEISPNMAGTALVRKGTFSSVSTEPTFVIPVEQLEAGKMYSIRVGAYGGGFTTSSTGDLRNRSLPISRALLESGLFTVTP